MPRAFREKFQSVGLGLLIFRIMKEEISKGDVDTKDTFPLQCHVQETTKYHTPSEKYDTCIM